MQFEPLGESAFLARFESSEAARLWAVAARGAGPWVVDVVAAYGTAAVFLDPDDEQIDEHEQTLRRLEPAREDPEPTRLHAIPVVYGGLDLKEIATRLGIPQEQVIQEHSGREYRVDAVGFQPGFPYAGDLPEVLRGLPRRESPRTKVPAGSVAIAGKQTAIYPAETPGGWHLLGRTPMAIVDVARGAFPIRVGDRLRFFPIGPEEFESRRGLLA